MIEGGWGGAGAVGRCERGQEEERERELEGGMEQWDRARVSQGRRSGSGNGRREGAVGQVEGEEGQAGVMVEAGEGRREGVRARVSEGRRSRERDLGRG